MSPLYLYNGKLLIKNGKLATSDNCCCDSDNDFAILLCNSNQADDRDYNVFLNNNLIGQYITADSFTQAALWVTNDNITKDSLSRINCADCALDPNSPNVEGGGLPQFPDLEEYPPGLELCEACAPEAIKKPVIDKGLFVNGNNTLEFRRKPYNPPPIRNPNAYGRVWVFKYSGNDVKSILLSDAYFSDNVPNNQPLVFTYNFDV